MEHTALNTTPEAFHTHDEELRGYFCLSESAAESIIKIAERQDTIDKSMRDEPHEYFGFGD